MHHLNTCSLLNKIALSLICQNLVWNRVAKLQYFVVWYRINKDFCDPAVSTPWDSSLDVFTTLNWHFESVIVHVSVHVVHGTSIQIYQVITANIILNCQVDLNDYGIDWDGPLPNQEWDGQHQDDDRTVEVPSTSFPLSQQVFEHLQRTIDPFKKYTKSWCRHLHGSCVYTRTTPE